MTAFLPRFKVCAVCRRHGRIELASGRSAEVCSQQAAQEQLVAAFIRNDLDAEQLEDLFHQIEGSGLPALQEQVDSGFFAALNRWLRLHEPDEAEDFHVTYVH